MCGWNRPLMYILDEHGVPIPCDDPLAWAEAQDRRFETPYGRVGEDTIDDVWISTVFLGNDLAHSGPPELWETALRRAGEWTVLDRYTCHADAVVGHVFWVQQARQHPHHLKEHG